MAQKKEQEQAMVDEFAKEMFASLGYEKNGLPESLVQTYSDFKKICQMIQPGRLSAEGYAAIILISQLREKKE